MIFSQASERTLFAHRGLNHRAPENTLAAFTLAADAGIEWIETDVDILGDGTTVVIHDTALDKTTDASGLIYDLTQEDLQKIDAGSWFDVAYRGERLPTLRETVDFANEYSMNFNFELKANLTGKAGSLRLIDAVIGELERLDSARRVIISSFSQLLLARFAEAAPQYKTAVLFERNSISDDWLSILELSGASYVHPNDQDVTPEQVRAFKEAGFGVNVWTVNSAARANQLFNWGCDGVMSDIADELMR